MGRVCVHKQFSAAFFLVSQKSANPIEDTTGSAAFLIRNKPITVQNSTYGTNLCARAVFCCVFFSFTKIREPHRRQHRFRCSSDQEQTATSAELYLWNGFVCTRSFLLRFSERVAHRSKNKCSYKTRFLKRYTQFLTYLLAITLTYEMTDFEGK